jgi:hypothetical protein
MKQRRSDSVSGRHVLTRTCAEALSKHSRTDGRDQYPQKSNRSDPICPYLCARNRGGTLLNRIDQYCRVALPSYDRLAANSLFFVQIASNKLCYALTVRIADFA